MARAATIRRKDVIPLTLVILFLLGFGLSGFFIIPIQTAVDCRRENAAGPAQCTISERALRGRLLKERILTGVSKADFEIYSKKPARPGLLLETLEGHVLLKEFSFGMQSKRIAASINTFLQSREGNDQFHDETAAPAIVVALLYGSLALGALLLFSLLTA